MKLAVVIIASFAGSLQRQTAHGSNLTEPMLNEQ